MRTFIWLVILFLSVPVAFAAIPPFNYIIVTYEGSPINETFYMAGMGCLNEQSIIRDIYKHAKPHPEELESIQLPEQNNNCTWKSVSYGECDADHCYSCKYEDCESKAPFPFSKYMFPGLGPDSIRFTFYIPNLKKTFVTAEIERTVTEPAMFEFDIKQDSTVELLKRKSFEKNQKSPFPIVSVVLVALAVLSLSTTALIVIFLKNKKPEKKNFKK